MENLQIIIGYLGADPEVKYMPDGTPKVSFSVATTDSWRDKNGEKNESTEWHQVEAWGAKGEACAKYLNKGRLVYVRGSHHTAQWEDDNGKHFRHILKAEKVKFLDRQGK